MDIEVCLVNVKGRTTFVRRRCKWENIQIDHESYRNNLWWIAFISGSKNDSLAGSFLLYPSPRDIPGILFYQRLSRLPGQSAAGKIKSMIKSNDLIGNRNSNFPAFSAVPQPTAPPRNHKQLTVKCSLICGKNTKTNELKIQLHYIQMFAKVMDSQIYITSVHQ